MNEGGPGLGLVLHGGGVGVVVNSFHQPDLRSQLLGGLHLADGRPIGHVNEGLDTALGGGHGHPLGVVAGAAGQDAPGLFLVGELADFIVSAPELEAAGLLKILGFQVQLALVGELGGFDQVGLAGHLFQHKGGVIDFIQCQHGSASHILS